MDNLKDIAEKINEKDHFLLIGHIDPDGDCIGSLFGLKWCLDILGKTSKVLLSESPSDYFKELNISQDEFFQLSDFNPEQLEWPEINMISLDAGDIDRLGKAKELFDIEADPFVINIDHHIDNTTYGDMNYVNADMAAVGIIIYELAAQLQVPVNNKIGKGLATAIIDDTGSFRYENTTSRVMKIIASLMEIGVDIYRINRMLYSNNSYKAVILKGLVLSTVQVSSDGKIAWLYVDQDMLAQAGVSEQYSGSFVNYARDIKGVEVGISFVEQKNERVKISFRSNDYCPVNEIAAKFSGGGHSRAAGCRIDSELSSAIEKIVEEVKKYV
jgi:phosphoesterase RecJ-like protein